MEEKTQAIVSLFGDNPKAEYSENFQKWECSYSLALKKIPDKGKLLAALPVPSDRDEWRLRMLNETDEDLFDIRKGSDIDSTYNVNHLQPYIDENVRLVYSIEKRKTEGVLTIYDLQQSLLYIKDLAVAGFYNALYNIVQEKLVLEIWGNEFEQFVTQSIAVIKKGDAIPKRGYDGEKRKRIEICGRYCQWSAKLPGLLPEDLHIEESNQEGELARHFKQACLMLSACYVADFSGVEKNAWRIRISGFKTLFSEGSRARMLDMTFEEKSESQWFDIYDWCYTGGYTSDRLTIARNIISLNCPDFEKLELNKSTLDAIKSNFRIFEQDNVRQYIKVRKDVSSDLLALQDKINSIVEGFTGDFRKSVVGLGTFFLTVVVVRVVAGGHWYEPFSNQIVALSLLFLALSVVALVYSRKTLEKKEQLYTKHYKQLRERYDQLLSKEEADQIFEDGDPNNLNSHSNYIQWQKNRYTWIWALTLVAFSLFLVGSWCYNLFGTTNICKIIKCITACCTKSI